MMQKHVEQALRERRPQIRARWLELLFVEPVNTPLANPRSLIFLLDETLDAVFAALRRASLNRGVPVPDCPCGRNPYLSYFRAGRQAMLESLVLLQAATPALDPDDRDAAVTELNAALARVAYEAIEGFGSLCQHRAFGPAGCDHPDCDRFDGVTSPAESIEDEDPAMQRG